MGSIIKTISLDGRTAKIAETIPNFSQWIRARLLDLEEKRITPKHTWSYYCEVCDWEWKNSDKDNFFYCMNKSCTNHARIIPKRIDLE